MLQFLQEHLNVRPNEMIHTVWTILDRISNTKLVLSSLKHKKWTAMDQIIETGRLQLNWHLVLTVEFSQRKRTIRFFLVEWPSLCWWMPMLHRPCKSRPSTFGRIVHLRVRSSDFENFNTTLSKRSNFPSSWWTIMSLWQRFKYLENLNRELERSS